jgi:hypothetical protein
MSLTSGGPSWEPDVRTPTRLGDAQITFRLAREARGSAVPWYQHEDTRRAWALSEKLEQQYPQHFQRRRADRPAVLPWQVRTQIVSLGRVPADGSLLLRQGLEFDFRRGTVAPHRPGGIGLREGEAGQSLPRT